MAVAGAICLAVALAICVYGIGASLYGARTGRRDYVASGRRSVYALAGVLAVAMAILQAAFVRSDFSFELVTTHSSTTTPLFYRLTSLLSREAVFLLNNLVLVALCFVVFWGTFFPLITEALGNEQSFTPPMFNRYVTPLALILVLLSGIGPLIAWRRATVANLRRNFALPLGALVLVPVALTAAGVTGSVPALLMFAFAAFVGTPVGQELWRGVRARPS